MNPLQNKGVVSALVVGAVVIVTARFVDWPARKTTVIARAAVVPAPVQAPEVLPQQAIVQQPDLLRASVRRDPFAWPSRQQSSPAGKRSFVLSAISIDGEKAFAVINQQVVGPGDRIGEYAVEEILPTCVRLSGPEGRIMARMAQ